MAGLTPVWHASIRKNIQGRQPCKIVRFGLRNGVVTRQPPCLLKGFPDGSPGEGPGAAVPQSSSGYSSESVVHAEGHSEYFAVRCGYFAECPSNFSMPGVRVPPALSCKNVQFIGKVLREYCKNCFVYQEDLRGLQRIFHL